MAASHLPVEPDWTLVSSSYSSSDDGGDGGRSKRDSKNIPHTDQDQGKLSALAGREVLHDSDHEVDDEGFVLPTDEDSDEVDDEGFVVSTEHGFKVQIEEDSWLHAVHSTVSSSNYRNSGKQEFYSRFSQEEEASVDAPLVKEDEGRDDGLKEDMHASTGPLSPENVHVADNTIIHKDEHEDVDHYSFNVHQSNNDEVLDGSRLATNHADKQAMDSGITSHTADMLPPAIDQSVVEEIKAQKKQLWMEALEQKDDAWDAKVEEVEQAGIRHREKPDQVKVSHKTIELDEITDEAATQETQEVSGLSQCLPNDQGEVQSKGGGRIKLGKGVIRTRKEAGACKLIMRNSDDPVVTSIARGERRARKKAREELADRIARSKVQLEFDEEQKASVQALEERLMNLEARYASQQEELARFKSHIQRRSRALDQDQEARVLCHDLMSEKKKRGEILLEAPRSKMYRRSSTTIHDQWPYKLSVHESIEESSTKTLFVEKYCKDLFKKLTPWSSSKDDVKTRDTRAHVPTNYLGRDVPGQQCRTEALHQTQNPTGRNLLDSITVVMATSGAMGVLGWMLAGCCNVCKSSGDEGVSEQS